MRPSCDTILNMQLVKNKIEQLLPESEWFEIES